MTDIDVWMVVDRFGNLIMHVFLTEASARHELGFIAPQQRPGSIIPLRLSADAVLFNVRDEFLTTRSAP